MPTDSAVLFIRPAQLSKSVPYAYAAIAAAGRPIFTAGACPLDADGNIVTVGDIAGQSRQVMANLLTTLHAAGAQATDVVKTTVYVASSRREDLVTAWEIVRGSLGDHDAPSTLLGVAVLGYPNQLVEVEAVAVAAP
jgi:enamine deaminase RidA (YjgF/YER057c/UK114 family)